MIWIKEKAKIPIPKVLLSQGKDETTALMNRYDAGERSFESKDFDSEIYGHADVKNALIKAQSYKCCFCESKIGHISYGDVEHFRPKSGWVQNVEKLNKPGYYWLAYDWENLLLSCQICNQRNKKNFFPLLNETIRSRSHHDNVTSEQPVFIHAANEDPEKLITFKEEIPVTISGNWRGAETILKLGLDRELLNEQRRKTLNMIRDVYDLAKGFPDTYPDLKQQATQTIIKYFNQSQSDETEYASMLRAFFRDNPVDFN